MNLLRWPKALFILVLPSLLFPLSGALAEEAYKADQLFILGFGNDVMGVSQSDRHFSNGLSIGWVTEEAPYFFEKIFSHGDDTVYSFSLNQHMYTPEDLSLEELIEEDRPYGGWLFFRMQAADRKGDRLTLSGAEIGVVGSYAMADELQKIIHEWTDSSPPAGWDNQLENELGINLFHVEAKNWRFEGKVIDNELVIHIAGVAGNVNTHAEAGALYRVGYNIPDDMAVSFLGNTAIGSLKGKSDFSAYVFVGTQGRYVLRDIFLDGNTFRDSHSVEKENFVGGVRAGIVLAFKGVEVGYSNTTVSEQFKGQTGSNSNGLIFIRFSRRF